MADGMEVDTHTLRFGADRCAEAAGMARAGGNKLASAAPMSGIFGDFSEAHAFHQAVSSAHQGHVERPNGHDHALTMVSDKGHQAAAVFVATDSQSAEAIEAAGGFVS